MLTLASNRPRFLPHWPLSAQTPQITMPTLSAGLLGMNPGVNRGRRNLPPLIVREVVARASRDLVRRPSLPQTLPDITPHFRPLHVGYDLTLFQGKMICHRDSILTAESL